MGLYLYERALNLLPADKRDIFVYLTFTLAILALQSIVELVGRWFGVILLPRKEFKDKSVVRQKLTNKVGESVWRFCFYTFALIYGYSVVSSKDFYHDSTKMWGVVQQNEQGVKEWFMSPIPTDLHFYYFVELSFYSAATFLHVTKTSVASHNKDYWVMLIHHISTITLISTSYYLNVYKVGVVVMLLHDWCDPFLEIAKLLKYFKFMDISLIMFSTFGLVFYITRLFMYPFFVLKSALTETVDLLALNSMYGTYYYVANFLLLVILVLNGIWAGFILKGLLKVIFQGSEVHDSRSDDEGDSS